MFKQADIASMTEVPLDEYNKSIINSIKHKYPDLRQESKAPTFALTYAGTWHTLMNQCGFSQEEAQQIENNFIELYQTAINWTKTKIQEASKIGYALLAFGLRLRTPILSQVILDNNATPYEANAEARTLGNAIGGQSYGLLNNRAANEFMDRVRDSEYKLDIKICAMIHDSMYFLIKMDPEVIKWVNDNLIDCMAWQDLPELHHDTIKLESELECFPYGWHLPVTILNDSTIKDIEELLFNGKGISSG